MRLALVTTLLMAGALGAPGLTQEWRGRARVDGRVLGEAGAPVAGATIDARRVPGPDGPRVRSDAEGHFIVDGITSGSWVLEVVAPGYRVRRLEVHLSRDSSWLGPLEVQLEMQTPPAARPDQAQLEREAPPAAGPEEAVPGGNEPPPLPPVVEDRGPVGYEDVLAALERGRVDQAREATATVEEGVPAETAILFEIGVGFLNAGETREAVAFFDRALEQDPAHVDARYRRALARLALGRRAEAREDLEAVLERQPNGALAAKAQLALAQLTPGPGEEQ